MNEGQRNDKTNAGSSYLCHSLPRSMCVRRLACPPARLLRGRSGRSLHSQPYWRLVASLSSLGTGKLPGPRKHKNNRRNSQTDNQQTDRQTTNKQADRQPTNRQTGTRSWVISQGGQLLISSVTSRDSHLTTGSAPWQRAQSSWRPAK